MSAAVTQAAYTRRTAHYARRTSRHGIFSARKDPAFGPWGLVICGLCGYGSFDDEALSPAGKADHLTEEHRAIVYGFVGPGGEAFYQWHITGG